MREHGPPVAPPPALPPALPPAPLPPSAALSRSKQEITPAPSQPINGRLTVKHGEAGVTVRPVTVISYWLKIQWAPGGPALLVPQRWEGFSKH